MSKPRGESAPPSSATVDAGAVAPPAHRSRWRRFSPSMGWPAFWSEILIVFLGVVIALAANEAVQEWTWRSKVKEAEVRLRHDVDTLFIWYAEAVVTQPCVDAQLEALGRRVLTSGEVLQPAPIHRSTTGVDQLASVPGRPYVFGTWDALVADGTATHFARDRQALFNSIARGVENARERGSATWGLLGRLQVMREPIPLDPVVRSTLLADIHELRLISQGAVNSSRQQMTRLERMYGGPDADGIDEFLYGGPQTDDAWDVSRTVVFCKAQGLPLADWRGFSEAPRLPASTAPAAGKTP